MKVRPETKCVGGTAELESREMIMLSLPIVEESVAQVDGSVGGAET
jgi:hypothetical protein